MKFVSFAQNGEDVVLWRALKNVTEGFYIDVGAYDPTEHSVTKAFYDRGWRGINIEPVEVYHQKFLLERWGDINLNIAVSNQAGLMQFHRIPGTGLSTLKGEIATRHEAGGWKKFDDTTTVLTLNDILAHLDPEHIHFLKIDVEGHEESVLKGIDLDRFRPWIIVIESTKPLTSERNDESWRHLIEGKNYINCFFDGLNLFFVAAEHEYLIQDVAQPANVLDDYIHIERLKERNQIPAKLDRIRIAEQEIRELQESILLIQENSEATLRDEEKRRLTLEQALQEQTTRRVGVEHTLQDEAAQRVIIEETLRDETARRIAAEKTHLQEIESLRAELIEQEEVIQSERLEHSAKIESLHKQSEILRAEIFNLKALLNSREIEIIARERETAFKEKLTFIAERDRLIGEIESQKISAKEKYLNSEDLIDNHPDTALFEEGGQSKHSLLDLLSESNLQVAIMSRYIGKLASGFSPKGWQQICRSKMTSKFIKSRIDFHLDSISIDTVIGWALNQERLNDPVVISASIDGKFFANTTADEFRHDLQSAGVGTGRYGFRLILPEQAIKHARETSLPILISASDRAKTILAVIPLTKSAAPRSHARPTPEEKRQHSHKNFGLQIGKTRLLPRARQVSTDLTSK